MTESNHNLPQKEHKEVPARQAGAVSKHTNPEFFILANSVNKHRLRKSDKPESRNRIKHPQTQPYNDQRARHQTSRI